MKPLDVIAFAPLLKAQRSRDWELAKAHLRATLATFYPEIDRPGQGERFKKIMYDFIECVEGEGLEG